MLSRGRIRHLFYLVMALAIAAGCAGTESIDAENRAPVANAGPDVTAAPGDVVMLDGSGSFDPDEDELIFRWELEKPQGSAAMLSSANFVETSFQPDVPGSYSVTLIVSDGELDSPPDQVVIDVSGTGANRAPEAGIVGAPALEASVGIELVLDASTSSDPDGDPLSFDWSLDGRPQGSTTDLLSAGGDEARLTPDAVGTYEVSLVVSDGEFSSPPLTVLINARDNADVPVANAGNDRSVEVGTEVTLDGSGSQGTALTYEWSLVRAPQGSGATLGGATSAMTTMTPDLAGEYEVRLVVRSDGVASAPDSVVITATQESSGNRAPDANAGTDAAGKTLEVVTLDGSASSDPDGDSLQFSWQITTSPSGSGAILTDETTDTPEFLADRIGDYVVELTVSDGSLTDVDTVAITVTGSMPTAAGDVLITEFLADPVDETNEEWFELHNPSDVDWDLEGCILSDLGSNSATIDQPLLIESGAYVTLAKSAMPGFTPDHVYGGAFQLANSDDEIIVTCGAAEIDSIAYTSSTFPYLSTVSAQLTTANYDVTQNDDGSNWCSGTATFDSGSSTGTPGAGPDC